MKRMNSIVSLVVFFASTFRIEAAVHQQEQRVVSGSTTCEARILSKDTVVLPNHCLENDKILMFEDFGARDIAVIDRKSPFQGAGTESLVTVRLRESVFPQGDLIKFASPQPGIATVRCNGIERKCQILSVDRLTKSFTHDCAQFQGQSGKAIYQNNKPVGLHLGQIKKSGLAIAAMENGPDFRANISQFEFYEPQGLKISCCKKFAKAVEKFGDAISDGAEAVKDFSNKTAENIKSEIGRIEKDISSLPKVFSVEYVQNRLPDVKLPKLPKIEMNQSISSGNAFKWNLPSIKIPTCVYPKINENSVLGKIITAVAKGLDDTGDALTKAGHDIGRWWPDTVKWVRSKAKISYPKDCDDMATAEQMKSCISNLKGEIGQQEAELKRLRGGAGRWVDDQRAAVGL